MRKVLILIIVFLCLINCSSCSLVDNFYNQVYDNELIESKKKYDSLVKKKEQLVAELAELETKYSDLSYKIDELKQRIANIDTEIEESFTLFHTLENETLKGAVIVTHYSYKESGWWKEEYISGGLGSGFIIKETSTYYYILTNHHVIDNEEGANKEYIYVYDYNLNEYQGTLMFSSEECDMAVVRIDKNTSFPLKIMELAENNPKGGDYVISIGQPNSQVNSISIGKVESYVLVDVVDYKVIYHTAWMDHGNSGGMLINLEQKVVGINTWGGIDNSYTNHQGYSSPVEKIKEFLDLNSFTL